MSIFQSFNLVTSPHERRTDGVVLVDFYRDVATLVERYVGLSLEDIAAGVTHAQKESGNSVNALTERRTHTVREIGSRNYSHEIEGVRIAFSSLETSEFDAVRGVASEFVSAMKLCERTFQLEEAGRELDLADLRSQFAQKLGLDASNDAS